MSYVVRCSFLLISISIGSMSLPATKVQVIKASGHDAIIECAAKIPQDGVYMYKQEGAKPMEIFYYYKDTTLTLKNNKSSASISLSVNFPKLYITLLNVTAKDIGLYWCEFNLEDKITVGHFTWLWIEKLEKEKDCPEDILPRVKIFLIFSAVMSLLCLIGFFCMILKMKGCWRNRKYTTSNPPSDSVYEEMKRSNLDAQPCVRTFINPEYQSTKILR